MPAKRLASTKKPGKESRKKARFAEPSQGPSSSTANDFDQAAYEDQVQAELEEVQTSSTRRGAIKTDGYDSDSSDDGEGVVLSRKPGTNEAAGGDDDMFAPPSDVTNSDPFQSAKKPKEKFLALGDIEGQEFGDGEVANRDRRESSASYEEDGFEDEDTRERRAKDGMGYEMSSFNMKEEMEEGKFAEDGTYHRTFDPHGMHDKWIEGINENEIKKARRIKRKIEEQERQRALQAESTAKGVNDVSMELVCLLEKGETVLEALQRIGKNSKLKQSTTSSRTRKSRSNATDTAVSISPGNTTSSPAALPRTKTEQSPIERITSLASDLMFLGNLDVYEETYESLLRAVRRSGTVPRDWEPSKPSDGKFEYRWSPSYLASTGTPVSSDVHGPFSKSELLAWREAAYFGEFGERIEIRKAGERDWGGWDVITAM